MRKKVLIVAYYWPPAGGPGVQRWLKFVKYLPDFNIEPIVYVPENPSYPILDASLEEEVSKQVTIIKQPISEPYKWAGWLFKKKTKTISKGIITGKNRQSVAEKLLLFIRGNFFIPDARKNWVSPSVRYLQSYIVSNHIDTVITTGPPHSMHLIGLALKRSLAVKWVADFRDPWTTIGYHKQLKLTKFARRKHLKMERKVLLEADHILVTSKVTKREFEAKTKQPITVITNGYDVTSVAKPELDTMFTVSHIGSLLSQRNPDILWRALQDIIQERADFRAYFQLNLVGYVSDEILKTLAYYGLSNYVNEYGYVSHEEAVVFQKKSQVLLLLEINSADTKCIIPGKLFEYMVSERPILAIGPDGSDVASILKETNTGVYFNYAHYEGLKKQILAYFEAFKANKLQTYGIGLQKYSRKALTKQLADLLTWEL
ncbi:glycosyltransferase family 4 protein [Bizionia sediminis]|uniref:Glycosyltransferase family 4 protein n=1 Tax=Bizionia sediminis TaxID=1737064 RepID=A0ABW5KT75_9FLAO